MIGRRGIVIDLDELDIERVNRAVNLLLVEIEILHARERVCRGWGSD